MRRLVLLPVLALLPVLVLLAAGCASPLPDADEPVDNGLRAVWTAFQAAIQAGDAGAIEALADPDPGDTYDPEGVPRAILDAASFDDDLRQALLTTRAQDLRPQDDGVYTFVYEVSGSDDEGNVYESGIYVYFRVARDGRAYLTGMLAAG